MSQWYLNLVDKMIRGRNWSEEPLSSELFFKPFITIARDPGSGGRPIAQMVADKLGFELYDDQFVEEVAKSAKLRKEILEDVDEKSRSQIDDLVYNLLNPEYVSERMYIRHLFKVVLHRAKEGKVVFLGRGTNFITPDAFGLNVRITAPYRVCVQRAVRYEKVGLKKAREIIKKVWSHRADFVKQYFGKNISNAKYYDLTINTTYFSMEQAADIVIKAFQKKFSPM